VNPILLALLGAPTVLGGVALTARFLVNLGGKDAADRYLAWLRQDKASRAAGPMRIFAFVYRMRPARYPVCTPTNISGQNLARSVRPATRKELTR
jgi:hypothetical protein